MGSKVAIIHDWLTGMRGGEKVLEAILELFPNAEIFTLLHNPGSVSRLIEERPIHASFINKLPFKKNKYRTYLPLFPIAIESFDLKKFNLIISTSHCVAKGIIPPPSAVHISYIHSPMRYVWDMYHDYFPKTGINFLIPLFANYLRIWDVTSSNRVDHFIANSRHVAKRIKKYYNREADVIHPPVDTDKYQISDQSDNYYLIVSAMVPYKRLELAIRTFNQSGKKLVVIGDGPQKKYLIKLAKDNITFKGWLENEALVRYYQRCRALIFPGEEDFGMVPVEAQCCGKPVIALARGGALESIIGYNGNNEKNCSGVFFYDTSVQSLQGAIDIHDAIAWHPKFIHQHAQEFSNARFKEQFLTFINRRLTQTKYL
jgi:glycosyltransferase involved in cell wall biosynthesis